MVVLITVVLLVVVDVVVFFVVVSAMLVVEVTVAEVLGVLEIYLKFLQVFSLVCRVADIWAQRKAMP